MGYRGDTGDIGAKGQQGWEGTPGAPGYIGPDGPRGKPGNMGPPGPQGPPGPIGNQGSLGRTGSQGLQGKEGEKGREGVFNGYVASTQCDGSVNEDIRYLDRFDVSCQGLLGTSFLNEFRMSRKCPNWAMRYERTCINAGTWIKVGVEGQNVNCDGWLRYGTGDRWLEAKRTYGVVSCANSAFGKDPAPGVAKECQCSPMAQSGATMCSDHNTGCQAIGQIQYLDRQPVNCPSGKALTKYRMRSCPGGDTTDFTCCQPTKGMVDCQVKYTNCQVSDGYPIVYLDRHDVAVSGRLVIGPLQTSIGLCGCCL